MKRCLLIALTGFIMSVVGSLMDSYITGGSTAHAQTFTCHKCDSQASDRELINHEVQQECPGGGKHKWCPDGAGHRTCGYGR